VEQQGVDVELKLLDPSGHEVAAMDSPNDKKGPEILTFVPSTPGKYTLEVAALDSKAEKGRYTIRREPIHQATNDDRKRVEVERLFMEGMVAKNKEGQMELAVNKFEAALKESLELKETLLAQYCLDWLINRAQSAGDSQRAVAYMEDGLQLAKSVDDKLSQAGWLNEMGAILRRTGDREKALNKLEQGLALVKEIRDADLEAVLLNNISLVYSNLGDYPKALEFQMQALDVVRKLGNKRYEGLMLMNAGALYEQLNQKPKALETFDRALSIANEIGDSEIKAQTFTLLGGHNFREGKYREALDFFNKSLPLKRTLDDKAGEAETLMSIGNVYDQLSEEDKAIEYLTQALAVVKGSVDKTRQMAVLISLGNLELQRNDSAMAMTYFNQASGIAQKVNDPYYLQQAVGGLAVAHHNLGELEKALEANKESLQLAEQIGDVSGMAASTENLAELYASLGKRDQASEYYKQALLTEQKIGEKGSEAIFLSNFEKFAADNAKRRLAIFYGKLSINLYQDLRRNIETLDKETQKRFLKSIGPVYRNVAQHLIAENRLPEAQQVLNSFKDQQFFDPNRSQLKQLSPILLTEREQAFALAYADKGERVGVASAQLSETNTTIGLRQPNPEETRKLQALQTSLQTASNEFLAVLAQAETEFSKGADEKDRVALVPDLSDMQGGLRATSEATKQRTVAIYTVVGKEQLSVILITPDNIVSSSTPIEDIDLNTKALQFYGLLQSPDYEPRILGKQLYDIILKPIEAELEKAHAQTLIWELDGILRYLPMAALSPDGKGYLVEKYQNVVFTRADKERMTRVSSPIWAGTGFGSSQPHVVDLLGDGDKIGFAGLPGVSAELNSIFRSANNSKGLVTGRVLVDAEFTKNSFYQEMAQKRPLVHISSHFAFRPGDDSRSFLLLGDGSALTLGEMKKQEKLFDGVELLTLSACNTAATLQDANGREIDGFAELAQRLGASAVMATLWSVSDSSTPWLMHDFYAARQNNTRITKAEALREAQLALLRGTAKAGTASRLDDRNGQMQLRVTADGKRDADTSRQANLIFVSALNAPKYQRDEKRPFAHPNYWSPFVLFGNWR
jgi:CHAT domain-containing protein/tetratricopeptide (TPR) repeat protein